MSVDLSQFIPTFLEESFEGLELMESSLLNLDDSDAEVINAIFRAAHSIKGGASTFGFDQVANFTHVAETLLDQVRSGKRQIDKELVNLLLQSVDCIRTLLIAARDGEECSDPQIQTVADQLQALLENGVDEDVGASSDSENAGDSSDASPDESAKGWVVVFEPDRGLLLTGNEPLLMFQALRDLGELTVIPNTSELPLFANIDQQELYLSWTLQLETNATQEEVLEVFEWVEDECEISIDPLTSGNSTDSAELERPASAEDEKTAAPEDPGKDSATAPSEKEKPKAAETAKPASTAKPAKKAAVESSSIRVDIDKVDALINRVGELVITQSMLGQVGLELEDLEHHATENLYEGLSQLERNTRDLQEEVMRIRMLPISFVFNRFPRMVHDISQKLGKKVELKLSGESTELDKTVMEKIGDPLVHLVRNSLDHGLESPEDRVAAGKDETGTVNLNAFHQGGYIVIEIIDDGRGLNKERILSKAIDNGLVTPDQPLTDDEINGLIFMPGFSTAEEVSDLSGRGVGMDVVRRNIESLGGHVSVKSEEGVGSTFAVSLPLTLAILDGQLIRVSENETYVVPLVSIVESLLVSTDSMNAIAGEESLYRFRDEYIPLLNLHKLFQLPGEPKPLDQCLLVVVEGGGCKVGLLVDDLLSQQQVVIKSLESNYKRIDGLSGATILGDGSVALIVDVSGVVKMGVDDEVRKALSNKAHQANHQKEEAVA